jgi:hypothetical protein
MFVVIGVDFEMPEAPNAYGPFATKEEAFSAASKLAAEMVEEHCLAGKLDSDGETAVWLEEAFHWQVHELQSVTTPGPE